MSIPQAQRPTQLAKKVFALVIGIGNYADQRIRSLHYTRADAEGFSTLLQDPGHLGLPADNIKLLVDQQATLREIKRAISTWLFQRADEDSTVLVFFAGHGGLETDKTAVEADGIAKYLLPWDTEVDDLFSTALSNSEFNQLLRAIRACRMVVFLDACYAAGVSRKGARDVGLVENPYERLLQGRGRLVIASAQPNQRSFEDDSLNHGIFTHHLLSALRGAADNDQDGFVSVLDVFDYLRREVPRSARQLANSLQEPMLIGETSSEILLPTDQLLVQQRAAAQAKAQAERDAVLHAKRRHLLELHERGELPLDAFQEALGLLAQENTQMNSAQQALRSQVDLLASGNLNTAVYLTTRNALRAGGTESAPRSTERGAGTVPAAQPKPAPKPVPKSAARTQFCIRCGAKRTGNSRFCIHCGTELPH